MYHARRIVSNCWIVENHHKSKRSSSPFPLLVVSEAFYWLATGFIGIAWSRNTDDDIDSHFDSFMFVRLMPENEDKHDMRSVNKAFDQKMKNFITYGISIFIK